jgi:hypothetical protein
MSLMEVDEAPQAIGTTRQVQPQPANTRAMPQGARTPHLFDPEDFANQVAQIHEESAARYGLTEVSEGVINMAQLPLGPKSMANPLEIKFSQPTVSLNFSSNGTINDLIAGLRNGTVQVSDVPPIRVVEYNGQLVTLDNRRLLAFQAAGIKEIPIQQLSLSDPVVQRDFLRKYNPIEGGNIIVVTPNAAGRADAEELLREYDKIK